MPRPGELAMLEGRAVIVRRLRPLPLEAVVRGYLIGSGWKDYQRTGQVCGMTLPSRTAPGRAAPRAHLYPGNEGRRGCPR